MNVKVLTILERQLFRTHSEHVSDLLLILDDSLKIYKVNQPRTILESLEFFKNNMFSRQSEYKVKIFNEIITTIEQSQSQLTLEAKNAILELCSRYLDSNLYLSRFSAYEDSFKRHLSRYGLNINLSSYNFDIEKSLYEVHVINFVHSALNKFSDDLDIRIQSQQSKFVVKETKIEQANKLIKLEPNLFGIGLNLNYLIRLFFRKKD